MDRVFQHYEGSVEAMKGASLSIFLSLIDETDNDVILIWVYDEKVKCWYRIFIDGVYCGVDRYPTNESESDSDDGLILIDHSDWFHGTVLESAIVSSSAKPDGPIALSMAFGNKNCKLVCESPDGKCRLEFSGPESPGDADGGRPGELL